MSLRAARVFCTFIVLMQAWFGGCQLSGNMSVEELLAPSPPTTGTSMNKKMWETLHHRYVEEIAAYKAQGGLDVLLYGDSLFESFRQKRLGFARSEFIDNFMAWTDLIQSQYRAASYSIAGDRTNNLLYRLQNGEGPEGLNAKVIVLLIGTNDVYYMDDHYGGEVDAAAHIVSLGIENVISELYWQAPSARIVVLSLLPVQPEKYDQLVGKVNQLVEEYVAQRTERLQYLDCGSRFYAVDGSRAANTTLIPDGVHPMGQGGWLLAECVLEAVQQALGEAAS